MLKQIIKNCCLIIALFCSSQVLATAYVYNDNDKTIGSFSQVTVGTAETLASLGLRYDIGLNEISNANPGINPHQILAEGSQVIIPSLYVLPKSKREGIVISLAQYRLYYFKPNDNVVITMPISIGRKGWETPVGETKIVAKVRDPIWRPSDNLKKDAFSKGILLPEEFPGGEVNPLGRQAFRLGWPGYLIHGSNRRSEIGIAASAGCIRLLPEDMANLFENVKIGTVVRVVTK